jgi:hypothetical protein
VAHIRRLLANVGWAGGPRSRVAHICLSLANVGRLTLSLLPGCPRFAERLQPERRYLPRTRLRSAVPFGAKMGSYALHP